MMKIECGYCERGCVIPEGGTGFCGMYTVAPGSGGPRVIERFPDAYSGVHLSHIEGVPFFHVMPGSRSLVLGGAGCTIDCAYCSNAFVARGEPEKALTCRLEPAEIVRIAIQTGCASVTYPINEPTVAIPTLLRLSEAARSAGLRFGILTNGFMTRDKARLLTAACDFANISVKAFTDDMYRRITGFSGLTALIRNIDMFHGGTHVEISTPVIQGVNDSELGAIARFIADIDPDLPWHVFRLLPEYRMAESARPDIGDIVRILAGERQRLRYIYFGNFVGSQWVGTECPACGETVVERMNFGGCGAKLVSDRLRDGRCPSCGKELPFLAPGLGKPVWAPDLAPPAEAIPAARISGHDTAAMGQGGPTPADIGCIDVVDWQTTLDLATGKPAALSHPLIDGVRRILADHPYPGDLTGAGSAWVTETALAVNDLYRPRLMLLNYGDLFFARSFLPPDDRRDADIRARVFSEIARFLEASDFEPVILGLGGLRRQAGAIPLLGLGLDGWAEAVGMTPSYAGIFDPSERDLARIASLPGVARVVTRDDFRALFGGCDAFYRRFPEALACAEPGWTFRGIGTTSRPVYGIPARDSRLPLHGNLRASHIVDLVPEILALLADRKVALIIAEGTGMDDFPLSCRPIDCSFHWHSYSYGEGHYHAVTSGLHFTELPYPPCHRSYLYDNPEKPFPFTAHFDRIEPLSIGRRFPGKSAAVGARSILTHATAGTDIVVECFSRALYNHGVMAAVNAGKTAETP